MVLSLAAHQGAHSGKKCNDIRSRHGLGGGLPQLASVHMGVNGAYHLQVAVSHESPE
jgi:hypothetical protein